MRNHNVVSDIDKKEWISEAPKAITAPARKAAIKIDYPALHPIAGKWNNKATVHSYKPGEFTTFIESVYDKADVTVYQRINQLTEGTNMKKTPDLEISIADLLTDVNKVKKVEKLFWRLRGVLSPPGKLSLPLCRRGKEKSRISQKDCTST